MVWLAPMPKHSHCWGMVMGAAWDTGQVLQKSIKGRERDKERRKKPISQGNPDPGLSRDLSTSGLLLLFNTDLKQPLNVVDLRFGQLWLPDLILGFHASQSSMFQGQPLLIPTPRIPFAGLASPLGTTDPCSSHPWLCDQPLSHIVILFITISPPFCFGATDSAPVCFHLPSFKARVVPAS